MTYAQGRLIHDADSHLMELDDCLDPWFEASRLEAFHALAIYRKKREPAGWAEKFRIMQEDPAFRAGDADNLLLRKNYQALGAFRREDRPKAIDLFGFASQLVFTTFCLGNFGLDESGDIDLCYAAASAHNRMMTDFCSVDRRLLATCYVPLVDFERARQAAVAAIGLGAKALLVPSRCPPGHSPSHIGFDPVWAVAQEAGLPILFHVGGELKLQADYFENGLPRVKDFHGGEENFTSVSFMAIPGSVMQSLACLIIDGVMDRFPRLKFGAIELGASWLPGWMRYMDSGHQAFHKNEERLHRLSAPPSEIVRRQVRATPYPHEDAGWIIRNSGEEVCLFSSDFPHVEGGRNPLKRFDDSLQGAASSARNRFFAENFIDLMGEGLAAELRRPQSAEGRLTAPEELRRPPPAGFGALMNAAVFMAVVLALALVRFFQAILSPLVVAAFMIVLVDGISGLVQRRLPGSPAWARGGLAGAVILAAFGTIAGLIIIEAPPFAAQIKALAPKLDMLLLNALAVVGAPPVTLEQMFSGIDPGKMIAVVFGTARHVTSFAALVIIYFGFLAASRATFSRKFERLYETSGRRASARRVLAAVGHAVERYAWLQTLKALLIALVAWGLMTALGVHDALFAAFLVFLSAYVPIVGAVAGSIFPGLLALAQFDDLTRPIATVAVLASSVFIIDNVIMPKLQGDELNLDPLFILISLGFWAAILGAPGVLLSTPLTVAVMAIASEFQATRWVAVLISRDGRPGGARDG